MKIAKTAFITTLIMLTLVLTGSAQTLRSIDENRNTAPTVGTGGSPGGPTGLFTIYDGQTLRGGEFTFSAAYSNYDRDPGDVDIVEVPISFQIGLSDNIELFFNTDAYRAIKVNSPANLSSFYLPNSQLLVGGVGVTSPPAIILSPQGPGTGLLSSTAVYRPTGAQPFVQYPFTGGNAGNFGVGNSGSIFGFPGGITLGNGSASNGNAASNFPGIGSVFGGILPGVVLQTVGLAASPTGQVPSVFTLQPSYLPDAPFINRTYGESAFNTYTVGGKIRFTGPNNPVGVGIIPFYRFYNDKADDFSGFNQLQRGASPGGNRGDFGLIGFADARLRKWLNISANVGYIYNASVKAGDTTLLDRPDELIAGVGVDFPVNRYFQPILEFRSTQYVGGRTPNAFENSPIEGLAGARFYPTRYISLGGAFRYHFNSQDRNFFDDDQVFGGSVFVPGGTGTIQNNFNGTPPSFRTSTDPYGFLAQLTLGRRNGRQGPVVNLPANVTNVELSEAVVKSPCGPGERPAEGTTCPDSMSVNVATTAIDPENDVLTYNYTVSGGRVVGTGPTVSWDLSGLTPGTYTITSGVDDGCGICGQTQTKTITVEKCDCVAACVCPSGPSVSVSPSGLITAGNSITFTANVTPGSVTPTYNWTVSQGEITSGQGTPAITVATTPQMAGSNVTANVEVGSGDAACPCPAVSASETAVIQGFPESRQVDEYGRLVNDDVKARIQNFYTQYLNNDPNNQGYIINYGSAREIARSEQQINAAIRFLGFEQSRVTLVSGGDRGQGQQTELYVVPAGATPPTPKQ